MTTQIIPDVIQNLLFNGIYVSRVNILRKPLDKCLVFDLHVRGTDELYYVETPEGWAGIYKNDMTLIKEVIYPSIKELVDLVASNMRAHHYNSWRPHVEDWYGIAIDGDNRWISHKDLTEAGYHRFADNSFLWVKEYNF